MAVKKFYHDIDLVNVGQLIGARLQNVTNAEKTTLASSLDPSHEGLQVWDTDDNAPYIWDGSAFVRDALVVEGDVVFRGSVDASASLDGTAEAVSGNQYVVSVGGTPSMTGVTFTPSVAVEPGDLILFTSATAATVLQRNLQDAIVDADFATAGIMATNGSGTYSVITDNSSNWNTAFGWGDHAQEGYLTSVALNDVSDVVITGAATGEFLRYDGTNWVDSAIQNSDITSTMVTQHQGNLSISESQISDLQSYLTSVALNDVTDVVITSAATGEFLRYDGSNWVDSAIQNGDITSTMVTQHQGNLSISESQISDLQSYLTGITGESIGELSDVTITAAADGEFLRYNGSAWVDSAIQNSDITSTMVTQHQGNLSISESQISDLQSYLTDITGESIGELSDVVITAAADGEFLRYDGTNWVDSAIQNSDITSTMVTQHQGNLSISESQISDLQSYLTTVALNDVSDVTITAAATGEFLRYNGSAWVDSAIQTTDITSAMVTQHEGDLTIAEGQLTFGAAFTTTATTVSGAINELDGEIGDLTTLATSEKGTLVGAINEIQTGTAGMKTYHNDNVSLNPGTPTTINHAFGLTNPNSYVISVFDTSGSSVSVDVDTVDGNNVNLTSLVGLTGVKVTIIGF